MNPVSVLGLIISLYEEALAAQQRIAYLEAENAELRGVQLSTEHPTEES